MDMYLNTGNLGTRGGSGYEYGDDVTRHPSNANGSYQSEVIYSSWLSLLHRV